MQGSKETEREQLYYVYYRCLGKADGWESGWRRFLELSTGMKRRIEYLICFGMRSSNVSSDYWRCCRVAGK